MEFLTSILFVGFLFNPFQVSAQIIIVEIMYDAEGSDSSFEWVEIINTGSAAIDIGTWYFYENETHHRLTPDGFSDLDPNERALIVQNLDNIYGLYGNALNLIKSSFSLNNTGETLSMSDENKTIQSTSTYSSDEGAVGNGNSLQVSGNSWIASEPTPGAANNSTGNNGSDNDPSETIDDSASDTTSNGSSKKVPVYTYAHIDVMSQAIAGSPVSIEAYVTKRKGNSSTKRFGGGIYYLNFGDGSFLETERLIEIEHIYEYPGEYELVFEFYDSRLAQKANKEPTFMVRKTLEVHEHSVIISQITNTSGIMMENATDIDIDLEGWSLVQISQDYTFPRYSILKARGSLIIPKSAHGLNSVHSSWLSLENDSNISVSSFSKKVPSPKSKGHVTETVVIETKETISHSGIDSALDRFLKEYPKKKRVDFGQAEAAMGEHTDSNLSLWTTALAGGLALVLVGIRIIYKKKEETSDFSTSNVIGEIELIE
ncbi:MAG: hypothetical protein ACJAV6_000418 [Candidatus Paceibacteria bacterium]